MKFDYRETSQDLLQRIDIHQKYGGRNIDDWMLGLLPLKAEQRILDAACGAGKQCFLYYDHLGGNAEITGVDVSTELLAKAQETAAQNGARVTFSEMDFNKPFPYERDYFDLVSSCFGIYYANDIPFTISEMHRVIKPGGTLFTTGPMPTNKMLFYDIIKAATSKPIPPMPGSSRYSTEILSTIKDKFAKIDLHIFENPLTFNEVEPLIAYTRASLSEDRKLWGDFFKDADDFSSTMEKITDEATRRLEQDGQLVMTKVVGGILATK
ncbi:MAG: class I SAM-dependent methyltransferase [Anaerolineales bacterium]